MSIVSHRWTGPHERTTPGPRETAERYYMNKAFGRNLERAKALEGELGKAKQEPSEVRRATIEPYSRGGHKVTIERLLEVMGNGREARESEHWFPEVESTIQFLHQVLNKGLTKHGEAEKRGLSEDGVDPLDERKVTGAADNGFGSDKAATADELA